MMHAVIGLSVAAVFLCALPVMAQTAKDIRGAAGVVPLASEPPAKIFIDPPLPDALLRDRVVIQYRTENLRIVQVFGPPGVIVPVFVQLEDQPPKATPFRAGAVKVTVVGTPFVNNG